MLKRIWSAIVLPKEISAFEAAYLKRMNRIGLIFFYLHLPVFMAVAAACGTGVRNAALLTGAILVGPTIAYRTLKNARLMSAIFGFTAMCMGGLLVHLGQGPMQIEMHFYFFVLLALLAVFANPMAIVVAAITVALHHLLLYLLLPASVFNYEASLWTVAVHALFVVLESVAACFVARSFFDNVIGLERIVAVRTHELDARNADLRLLFDSVGQGFMSVDRAGRMSLERSAVVDQWFGAVRADEAFWIFLSRSDAKFADWFKVGWDALLDDVLPLELAIDQLPGSATVGARTYGVEYRPIVIDGVLVKLLVIFSDITARLASERLEAEQRETIRVFERISRDRSGFREFLDEAQGTIDKLLAPARLERAEIDRAIHTLKGNAGIFGMSSLATICHELETKLVDEDRPPTGAELGVLEARWATLTTLTNGLLGDRRANTLEIDAADYDRLIDASVRGVAADELFRQVSSWRLEPTERRLARVAEQAVALGARLGKSVEVSVSANQLRLAADRWSGFWSSFIHVIRNSMDHGIESPEERSRAAKPVVGKIEISTYTELKEFVVQVSDDGAGIDWPRVASRAAARGLPYATPADLTEALFANGLSTSEHVTDVSGRGIGMGAMRRECEERGGVVKVLSTPGKGTTVQFRFALTAMNPVKVTRAELLGTHARQVASASIERAS